MFFTIFLIFPLDKIKNLMYNLSQRDSDSVSSEGHLTSNQ